LTFFLSLTLNRVTVRLRVRISDLLAYITYFIVTLVIRPVQRASILAATTRAAANE